MTAGNAVTFAARYRGFCYECRTPFEPGDLIAYAEGHPSPVHADCADVDAPDPKPETICPTCWLVQPCDCEER